MAEHKTNSHGLTKSQVKSEVDELFRYAVAYRKSTKFLEILEFIRKFRHLSPYNAFLVYNQKPGSQYVLTRERWLEYGRTPKRDARPLIILRPFGPIEFVYDLSDTERTDNNLPRERNLFDIGDEQELLERLAKPFEPYGEISDKSMAILKNNLPFQGIEFDYFRTGSTYVGKLHLMCEDKPAIWVPKTKEKAIKWLANYRICVQEGASKSQTFVTLCHELGHFFSSHLPSPGPSWPEQRHLSDISEEFEAEAIAWIVCRRLDIESQADRYIAGYIESNENIPDGISIENIFTASKKILDMIDAPQSYKQGALWKYDSDFQTAMKKL